MTSPYEAIVHIVEELEEAITSLDVLGDVSDADMALMYLRHLKKALTPTATVSTKDKETA